MPEESVPGAAVPEKSSSSLYDHLAAMSRAAASLSIVVGVIAGIIGLINGVQSLHTSAMADRQKNYPVAQQVISDNTKLEPNEVKFLHDFSGDAGKAKLRLLVQGKGNAADAYYSDDLEDLRAIGRHYEQMGALVKHGYIDFDLLFDVIPFPDEFWDETAEFRHTAQTGNWSDGKPLPDFWKNFTFLHDQYEKRRTAGAH
jgi:hypothetical protein